MLQTSLSTVCDHDDHVTQAAIDLHWLLAEARVKYKALHTGTPRSCRQAPAHITDLLQPVASMSSRHPVLRSATTDSLYVPRTRLLFGERAFQVAAPIMWNGINSHRTSALQNILTLS